ncbi:hypothetical protein Rhal01_03340 [Rubritalea halochordaticola]|uniref:SGNH/GDSL hydrolase family protein n=2 Tax=Rubritalea halochordaticola TaxID=714537 RepID=A0ABP9V596_9BACT
MVQPRNMKRIALLLICLFASVGFLEAAQHVILTGGPALRKWENYRTERDRHDRWWANFVRASTLRMDEIRRAYGTEGTSFVWYVYRTGYDKRGREDGKPYTTWITEQAAKRNARLVWINSGNDFISKFNRLPARSVATFDFFGHSNKHCFLLDYSSQILGASAAWLHESQLRSLSGRPLAKGAICKSWGCHTAESMSKYWKSATGVPLIGAVGKTDYATLTHGKLPSVSGRWSQ